MSTFVCYYYYVGWGCWSLGFTIDLSCPNIEIHVPTGFIRIGMSCDPDEYPDEVKRRTFGFHFTRKGRTLTAWPRRAALLVLLPALALAGSWGGIVRALGRHW